MRVSANHVQVICGKSYLNVDDESGLFLSASSVVYEKVIHVIAWGKDSKNCIFTVICIEAENWEYWLSTKREQYGKVLLIASGGVENLPPNTSISRQPPYPNRLASRLLQKLNR